MTTDLKELIERAKSVDGDFAEMNPGLTMQYVHALAERLEAELCAVVKPLEWEGDEKHSYAIGTLTGNSYSISPSVVDDHLGDMRISGPWTGFRYASTMEKAQALAQSEETYRILSAITTRPATEVYAEGFAAGIEAAVPLLQQLENIVGGILSRLDDALAPEGEGAASMHSHGQTPDWFVEAASASCHSVRRLRELHTTDSLAAIERIKEQARQEERDRCHNAIMAWDIEAYYRDGGRIQFDDMQEFFAGFVESIYTDAKAIREGEQCPTTGSD